METPFFILFALISVVGSICVITLKNVVHAAVALLTSFLGVAGLFLLMNAEFIAVIQILIYAGAVMILFLFAIFLLDIEKLRTARTYLRQRKIALPFVGLFTIVLLAGASMVSTKGAVTGAETPEYIASVGGNIEAIGRVMYTKYLLPFEIVSILLLAAMIGAIVISRRELK